MVLGTLLAVNGGQAFATDMPGRVTFYADKFLGQITADGTVLGPDVCAVDNDIYNSIPPGTMMVTKNNENGKIHTFYKHDYGYFPSGTVLDIIKADFTSKMGGSTTKGYFNGNVTYY